MPTESKNTHLVAIGRHIRAMREAAGYSQEDFADHAEMDRTYYGGIERGERNVSVLNLIRLAHAFNCNIGELFPDSINRRRR